MVNVIVSAPYIPPAPKAQSLLSVNNQTQAVMVTVREGSSLEYTQEIALHLRQEWV
jgi:hypothetical protein